MKRYLSGLVQRLSPERKRRIKTLVTRLFDLGKGEYFSQFGEDVFLQTFFHARYINEHYAGVPLLLQPAHAVGEGFYVEVGAYAPKLYSNSYWFYKQGWRGINIDGSPGSMEAFDRVRPRDINIEAVVSDVEEEAVFYHWETPFMVNTLDPSSAANYARRFGREPQQLRVQTQRLESILDTNMPQGKEISFMSIDAEGFDLQVLSSNNWEKYRPELVLVEDVSIRLDKFSESPVFCFLSEVGYEPIAWIRPTTIYRRQDVRDFDASLISEFHSPPSPSRSSARD